MAEAFINLFFVVVTNEFMVTIMCFFLFLVPNWKNSLLLNQN